MVNSISRKVCNLTTRRLQLVGRIRNDLTGAERKAFAAEVGRLILRLRENSTDEDNSTVESQWFVEFCEKSGISAAGGYKWWSSFTKSAGLSITPKQATDENRQAFFAWLEAQKQVERRIEQCFVYQPPPADSYIQIETN